MNFTISNRKEGGWDSNGIPDTHDTIMSIIILLSQIGAVLYTHIIHGFVLLWPSFTPPYSNIIKYNECNCHTVQVQVAI